MARRRADRATRSSRRRRRLRVAIGALVLGVLVAFLAGDEISDRLREVTLPLRHEDIIRQQASDKGIPADLIAAVIYAESRFRDQTSYAGARGLMQITRPTADEIERLSGGETFTYDDLADPDINIRYGTFYLAHLLDLFDQNKVAAIAAYNAGPAQVEQWGGSELTLDDVGFDETRGYVETVLEKRGEYREHYAGELGL